MLLLLTHRCVVQDFNLLLVDGLLCFISNVCLESFHPSPDLFDQVLHFVGKLVESQCLSFFGETTWLGGHALKVRHENQKAMVLEHNPMTQRPQRPLL